MNDFTGRVKRDEWKPPSGFQRTVTVALDAAQYQLDMETMAANKSEDPYSTFNLLLRRKPKVRPPPTYHRSGTPPWLSLLDKCRESDPE